MMTGSRGGDSIFPYSGIRQVRKPALISKVGESSPDLLRGQSGGYCDQTKPRAGWQCPLVALFFCCIEFCHQQVIFPIHSFAAMESLNKTAETDDEQEYRYRPLNPAEVVWNRLVILFHVV
jgi:hypothetical protein